MRKAATIILFLFVLFEPLSAQDYIVNVQQFGIEEGLLHRDVMSVFEDKNGLIWIGGYKGLQRYDGHEFKSWSKTNRTGLLYYISNIIQDDAGWLWLWNNDALQVVFFNPETEEILTFEERFGEQSSVKEKDLPINSIGHNLRLFRTSSGAIAFGDSKNNQILTFSSKSGFEYINTEITAPFLIEYIDQQDNFWIITDAMQIVKVNKHGKIVQTINESKPFYTNQISASGNATYIIQGLNKDALTVPSQLIRFDEKDNQVSSEKISGSEAFISGNFLWELKEEGWQVYEMNTHKSIFTLPKENYDEKLFEIFADAYQDSKGRVWIFGELGLNKVIIQPSKFKNYLSFEEGNSKPFNNSVRGIWVDKDAIFTNLEFTGTFRGNKNAPTEWTLINDSKHARPILKKENNEVWIGTPKSILQLDSNGTLINTFYSKEKVFNGTWSFFEDSNKRLWIGAGEDLIYKNPNEDFIRFYSPTQDPFDFTKRRGAIQNMIPAQNGLVWFCSWTGLYLFDPQNEKILARYASDEEGEHYFPADKFYYIYEEEADIKWVGTSEGLIRWDQNQEKETKYQIFTRKEGLSNDVIYAIFEDNHNRLWMSSDYGIMAFNKHTFDVKTYLKKDGITHEEFNRTAQFQTAEGQIYFGGLNGITSFHPDDFTLKEEGAAKMLISDFEIFDGKEGKLVNKFKEISKTKIINFNPNDRFFRLKFSLLTFEETSKMLYGWKIEGVDEDWNFQKENAIQIGILPYGSHTLRIKGQSGGGWSPHELAIQVQVLKPFYLQTWFILASILVLILGVIWFVKRRTRLLKETQKLLETEVQKATAQIESDKRTIEIQAEELRQLDKVKSRFFANVSHELRTPLTLMLGPISSVLKGKNLSNKDFTLLKKAQTGGKDLLKLVGSILDLSKMEAGKMELHETPENLFALTRRIAANFESHAERQGVKFEYNYTAEPTLRLSLDKDKLTIILNNLLSNAIKFTSNGGNISMTITDLSNLIQITVEDTGRGIHPTDLPNVFNRFYQSTQPAAPTEGGTGIGLALSQEFVKLMEGKIWVESQLTKGSTFFVQFPRKEVLGAAHDDAPILEEEQLTTVPILEVADNESSAKAADTPTQTILVVEDNYSLRDYIATILKPHYEILTAENGQVALNLLQDESSANIPHLIISDIMMPVMDGYQLLEQVKSTAKLSSLPVIMLTARADIQDKLKALRIGVDDYLLKPFVEEELLVRIENLLENRDNRNAFLVENEMVTTTESSAIKNSAEELHWLKELEITLKTKIDNPAYSLAQMSADFAMSESTFTRQLKRLTGLTPIRYLQELRLSEARRFLENREYRTIAKVAFQVGFRDANAFSRAFKKRFGKSPSDFVNQ